jgi:FRG domain
MTEPELREEARAADDATISSAHRSTITVSDLTELVAAVQEIQLPFNHDRAWWRGHASAEWRLVPQAFRRNPERAERLYEETALIGHFVSRAPSRSHTPCPDADDFFGWLFLAQHYGLPTRLLDWTENPLFAAYFAVLHPTDNDGCIWALRPKGLNRVFRAADGLVQIRDTNVRKIAESAFTGKRWPEEIIIALDGQEIDPRMLAQMSRFTLHSHPTPVMGPFEISEP